jgi:hypothetical protein
MLRYSIKYMMMQETDLDWPSAQCTKTTPPSFSDLSALGLNYL